MILDHQLPIIFAGLMAFSVLVYAILDGYDLGVGLLLPMDNQQQRDKMIASIGPFWDANETWLVLAVGLMLVAFPSAHSIILKALYLPTAILLIGLIIRGVSFDFRAKVIAHKKDRWDKLFKLGSFIAAAAQGYMLGMFVMGFEISLKSVAFSLLSAAGVAMAYALIGACWLIMKAEGQLQLRAIKWAKNAGKVCLVGILAVCIINPLINSFVFERWTQPPLAYLIALVPILCFAFFVIGYFTLQKLPLKDDAGCWLPFVLCTAIFTFSFLGLAFSFYPFVVPGELNIWQAASAPESLRVILYGALIVIPCIFAYTLFSYRVFWGKVRDLEYH
ncbi:cytochrome d ubiquinol oxidase subunit II [Aliiglaciecola sp. 3_MG-2023]|uniref:cytochrome d ubiquinol oxidase subunit II n=1 Tax=Aliiglaciecola sp. 3_MG-2023 TaxID=3062644 RepID=UPI0026E1C145|nr:cytochrome d ubiquinol oxidase subunit II [Aliiglaciecola sp. 3_MG-2023]MDO6694903.1 cytochrome d ubiquinol oxidase subunit II [Aliiglaciecola sp. 3_MG-2023]